MFTYIFIAVACALVYFLRRNFRRAWYMLRTGDEHPDWEKLSQGFRFWDSFGVRIGKRSTTACARSYFVRLVISFIVVDVNIRTRTR